MFWKIKVVQNPSENGLGEKILLLLLQFSGSEDGFSMSVVRPKMVPWKHQFCFQLYYCAAAAAAKSLQSCPTLRDPIDSSPPGSPVPGILQPRTLEWVAISFSKAWKWKVKVKSLNCVRLSDPMDCSLPGSSFHGIFQARDFPTHKYFKIFALFLFWNAQYRRNY